MVTSSWRGNVLGEVFAARTWLPGHCSRGPIPSPFCRHIRGADDHRLPDLERAALGARGLGEPLRAVPVNGSGVRLNVLDQAGGFQYARIANGLGAFSITLPGDFDRDLLRVDRLVEFWRASEGQRLGLEFIGFLRGWTWNTDANGQTTLTIRGPDMNDLLRRRDHRLRRWLGAGDDDRPSRRHDQGRRSRQPGVGRNCRPRPVAYGFSVAADLAAGPAIDGAFAWKNLLDVCKDLVSAAWVNGTRIYFDIVPTTPTTFQFRTWVGSGRRPHLSRRHGAADIRPGIRQP